jgi:hypothetical protein
MLVERRFQLQRVSADMTNGNHLLIHAMGELPAYLRDLALSVSAGAKSDLGMALSTLISGMASAAHGLRIVERPDGGNEPLAMFHMVFAGTTSGKTETYRLVHKAHKAHDVRRYEAFSASTNPRARLRDVMQPLTNSRALLDSLEGVGHATTISSSDGNGMLASYFFRSQLDLANVLWDGDDKLAIARPNGKRILALDGSLGLLLMVQREFIDSYLAKHGEAARKIGFLARCLFTVASTYPSDQHWHRWDGGGGLEAYYEQVTMYLDTQLERVEAGRGVREPIRFSGPAQALWFQLELELKGRVFHSFWTQDAVKRAMQNVTRLAGTIHLYYPKISRLRVHDGALDEDGEEDEISVRTLRAAWALVQWYLSTFGEVFCPPPIVPAEPPRPSVVERRLERIREDADTLMLHFGMQCERAGSSEALKRVVRMRSNLYQQRFDAALYCLTDQNFIVVEGEGRGARLRAGERRYVRQAAGSTP